MLPWLPWFVLAALSYGLVTGRGETGARTPKILLAAAAAFHLATIGGQCVGGNHPFQSIHLATSFTLLLAVLGYLALTLRGGSLRALGAVLAPAGLVGLTLGVVMGPGADAAPSRTVVLVHIASATIGVAGFSLAAGVAGMYLGLDRRLREKKLILEKGQPAMSLTGLDRLHHRMMLGVTPVFTVAIITGALALRGEGGEMILAQRAVELSAAGVAWLASLAVIMSRAVWGFRGRRAAWLTILAFACMLLILISYGVRA